MFVAIEEAQYGIRNKDGGPFGAVVVKDGKIIGRGHNRVLLKQNPTCHGEVEAISDACKNIGSFDLNGINFLYGLIAFLDKLINLMLPS